MVENQLNAELRQLKSDRFAASRAYRTASPKAQADLLKDIQDYDARISEINIQLGKKG